MWLLLVLHLNCKSFTTSQNRHSDVADANDVQLGNFMQGVDMCVSQTQSVPVPVWSTRFPGEFPPPPPPPRELWKSVNMFQDPRRMKCSYTYIITWRRIYTNNTTQSNCKLNRDMGDCTAAFTGCSAVVRNEQSNKREKIFFVLSWDPNSSLVCEIPVL